MYLNPNCRSLLSSAAILQAYSGKSRLIKPNISDLFKFYLAYCSRSVFRCSLPFQLLFAIEELTTHIDISQQCFHFPKTTFLMWNSDNFPFDNDRAGPHAPNSFIFFFVRILFRQRSRIKIKLLHLAPK